MKQQSESHSTSISALLQERMEHHNSNDKITLIQEKIDEIKDLMIVNIDKVLDQQEQLLRLVEKTETLKKSAMEFKKKTQKLKLFSSTASISDSYETYTAANSFL